MFVCIAEMEFAFRIEYHHHPHSLMVTWWKYLDSTDTQFFYFSVMTSNCAGASRCHLFIVSYSSTKKVSADLFEIVCISCCIRLSYSLLY
jgi:hypothetical protein